LTPAGTISYPKALRKAMKGETKNPIRILKASIVGTKQT
jgi:hypothetical protein